MWWEAHRLISWVSDLALSCWECLSKVSSRALYWRAMRSEYTSWKLCSRR